jgi:DNA repair exonuclease SbcCD nuclease subunit
MDREIRILHTADTHLGYRQYHSEVRRQDFFKAFEVVINDAVEMQVDAVVHAGDLFDSRNPTLEDLLETISILSRLKAAGIPFFGIVGNHESKQNTQWLDLFEEMGLAARLGKKPQVIGKGDAAIYGIDSVPKSKIPIFDYSGFEAPESCTSLLENCWKLLVMHQIVQPFPYAEWDCAETLEKLPFRIDAILLGDYHKYEKFKVGETWVTYPGSTERNSASEFEPRSYNIITLSDEGIEISKRTIPTRKFLPPIRVKLDGEENLYEQIFSVINEHLEELPGSVVFLEISGDSGKVLSFSEIEEYLLNKGVLVSKVNDLRKKESLPDDILKVTFSDPDRAVANEIRRLSLNDGGLIVDEIIRSPDISRSRVDEETEGRLSKLIEAKNIDFKDPDFRIEAHTLPEGEIEQVEYFKPAKEAEFIKEVESKLSDVNLKAFAPVSVAVFESEDRPVSASASESSPESVSISAFAPEISNLNSEDHEIKTKINTEEGNRKIEPEIEPGKEPEIEPENLPEPRNEVEVIPDENSGCITGEQSEDEPVKQSEDEPVKQSEEKPFKIPDEKPVRVSDISGKTGKAGQKRGKGKPAVPRQYNLGDYL